jgi:hypothetical protein
MLKEAKEKELHENKKISGARRIKLPTIRKQI